MPTAQLAGDVRAELQSRNSTYWLNLAAAGLMVFYLIYSGWQLMANGMCIQFAVDYCDYWSAGQAASRYGYAQVYDVNVLVSIQKTIMPASMDTTHLVADPFPYLPVFVVPFQIPSRLSPTVGFGLFTLCSVVALILYLRFFMRRLGIASGWPRLVLLIFVSLPGFMNVLTGQVEVWLAVCVGEFLRALIDRRPFRAGLWLGGLLLKPQVLVVVGLVLLLHRSVKILAGAAATSALLLIASLALEGPRALAAMVGLWGGYATGEANVWVQGMMNLRMLGMQLSDLAGPWIGWGLAGGSILAVLLIALYVWRRPAPPDSPLLPVSMLGIFAATTLIAWHAQIHMALLVVPPLLYAYQTRLLPERIFNYWVFAPAGMLVAMAFVPEALVATGVISGNIQTLVYFGLGFTELTANLLMFWWAVRTSVQEAPAFALATPE